MDLSNYFGLINGAVAGEAPLYVDKSLRPGSSEVPKPTVLGWIQKSPFVLVTSPNFVWAVIALALYGVFPYDLGAGSAAALAPLSSRFFAERFPLWFAVTLGYASLWHVALYWFHVAKRPFIEARKYSVGKVLHNLAWTTSGVAIWTGFENIVCHLWATGRLSYIPDITSFGSVGGFCAFLLALGGVPLWRSLHFYFAHRFLHMDAMYKQVHSLHHRNTDVEPFSGLCMHPVEHLYYFACVGPSLVFYCTPFAFLWNGVHLLLSPAASHSGYEDHFQSDVFHYMHHRYFECNYAGTDAAFLDLWFGTFKGSFDDADKEADPTPRDDAKSTLWAGYTPEFLTYLGLSAGCVVPWVFRGGAEVSGVEAAGLAVLAGAGPIGAAALVSAVWGGRRGVMPTRMSTSGNVLHVVVGVLFCCAPVALMVWLSLAPI